MHVGSCEGAGRWDVDGLAHTQSSLLNAVSGEARWRLWRTSIAVTCMKGDGWYWTSTICVSGYKSQMLLDLLMFSREVWIPDICKMQRSNKTWVNILASPPKNMNGAISCPPMQGFCNIKNGEVLNMNVKIMGEWQGEWIKKDGQCHFLFYVLLLFPCLIDLVLPISVQSYQKQCLFNATHISLLSLLPCVQLFSYNLSLPHF